MVLLGGKNGSVKLFQKLNRVGFIRDIFNVPVRVFDFVIQSIRILLAHGYFTPVESLAWKVLVDLGSHGVDG
jgi:hypothetical protein